LKNKFKITNCFRKYLRVTQKRSKIVLIIETMKIGEKNDVDLKKEDEVDPIDILIRMRTTIEWVLGVVFQLTAADHSERRGCFPGARSFGLFRNVQWLREREEKKTISFVDQSVFCPQLYLATDVKHVRCEILQYYEFATVFIFSLRHQFHWCENSSAFDIPFRHSFSWCEKPPCVYFPSCISPLMWNPCC
jgi:hypothetical protein